MTLSTRSFALETPLQSDSADAYSAPKPRSWWESRGYSRRTVIFEGRRAPDHRTRGRATTRNRVCFPASPTGFEPLPGNFENRMRNADLAVITAKLQRGSVPLVPSRSVWFRRETCSHGNLTATNLGDPDEESRAGFGQWMGNEARQSERFGRFTNVLRDEGRARSSSTRID